MVLFPISNTVFDQLQLQARREAARRAAERTQPPVEELPPFGPRRDPGFRPSVLDFRRDPRNVQANLFQPGAPQPVAGPLAVPTTDPSVITPPERSKIAPELTGKPFFHEAPFADLPPGQEIENRLNDPRSVQLTGSQLISLPFNVLDETTAELFAQVPKVFRGEGRDIELPTVLQPGEGKILLANQQFENRSTIQQIGLGISSTVATGGAGLAAKGAAKGTILAGKLAGKLIFAETADAARLASRRIGEDVVESLTGSIAPGRAKRLEDLQEFGLTLDSSANEFAAPLRPWQAVEADVVSGGLPATVAARLGVNPSAGRSSSVGRAITTYQRQQVASDQMVSTAMAAAFDSHLGQFRGLPVDPNTGFWKGTGVPWQKVFEQPDKFAKHIDARQRRLIDNVNQMTNDEVTRLLDDNGIDQRIRSRPDNEYYVPRNVEEIRGIELRRGSDPNLQRHYEDITEGLDAGAVYGKNPRQDIELYMRWAYRKVTKKQLDDALELESVTAKQLVPEDIRVAYADAIVARRRIEITRRRVRKAITTAEAQGRTAAVRTGERARLLQRLQDEVDRLDEVIDGLPDPGPVAVEPTRIELQNARRGVAAAKSLTQRSERELREATNQLARLAGKGQGTAEELNRLARQFERLSSLRDEIAVDPVQQLLEGKAPAARSPAALREATVRRTRFGALSTEARLTEARTVGAQRRFVNLGDAQVQVQRQVAGLQQDIQVARQLTSDASKRLQSATTGAVRREGQRQTGRGKSIQARRQRQRATVQSITQGRRTVSAEGLQAEISTRREILKSQMENIDLQVEATRATHREARTAYLNRIKELTAGKAEVGPGDLWGLTQPNEIAIGAWRNRYFQRADADLLNDLVGKEAAPGIAAKSLQNLVNTIRFLSTVGDFALPLTHGLPVLATDPVAWAKMTFQHERAFFFPTVQSKLIRDNLADYQWLARHGVPIGDPEFFAALESGQGVSFQALFNALPKGDEVQRFSRQAGRQTFGRFQASYNTGLSWARVQLLKGAREGWKGSDAELAQYIRNLTGGLDSKALGVTPFQRAAEGVWLAFSPRLLRSTLALTKDAIFNPTSQVGRRSLRSLAVLATGAISTYVMTGIALGKDWEEIEPGLNPLNGKRFLSYQINGDWIGVGGQVRAIAQLLSTSIAAPDQLLTNDRYENPLIKFVTGRAAIGQALAGGAIEAFTGGKVDALPFEEIDGPLDLVKHVGESALPFTAQGRMEGEQLLTTVFAFRGFRTSPETVFEKRNAAREIAKGQLGITKADDELDFADKAQIDKLVPEDVKQGVADLQRRRGSEIQAFTDRLNAIDEETDRSIDIAAAEGSGKFFRDRLSDLNKTRADKKETERTGPQNAEALKFFEELEPSEARLDIVRDAYFAATTDPRLEDDLGDFDFDRLERNIQAVRDQFSAEEVTEVEKAIRDDEHPLAKELRADRETLRTYWRIREHAANNWQRFPEFRNEAHSQFYLGWLDAPPTLKDALRKRFPHLINPIEQLVRRRQIALRRKPGIGHVIDGLLAKWEYSTAEPQTVGGQIQRERVLEGQLGGQLGGR